MTCDVEVCVERDCDMGISEAVLGRMDDVAVAFDAYAMERASPAQRDRMTESTNGDNRKTFLRETIDDFVMSFVALRSSGFNMEEIESEIGVVLDAMETEMVRYKRGPGNPHLNVISPPSVVVLGLTVNV